jgi:hypothetical protein
LHDCDADDDQRDSGPAGEGHPLAERRPASRDAGAQLGAPAAALRMVAPKTSKTIARDRYNPCAMLHPPRPTAPRAAAAKRRPGQHTWRQSRTLQAPTLIHSPSLKQTSSSQARFGVQLV